MLTQTFRGAEGGRGGFFTSMMGSVAFSKQLVTDIKLELGKCHGGHVRDSLFIHNYNGKGFLSNIGLDWKNSEFA